MKMTQLEHAMELLHRAKLIVSAEIHLKHDDDEKLETMIIYFDRILDELDLVNESNKNKVEKKTLVV